ncbi:hypothetical protein BKA59DRAFT_450806 [Fusarium tricinctum]|uniref:Uncharacterized protein n=1 Tax=Fusarium tricinctum TaxID=61284 RepID=A0A8K0WEN9_9HYPO|nr:hypothetical protein BKA59DRAFT_450806 [Fusarium tricinctum]
MTALTGQSSSVNDLVTGLGRNRRLFLATGQPEILCRIEWFWQNPPATITFLLASANPGGGYEIDIPRSDKKSENDEICYKGLYTREFLVSILSFHLISKPATAILSLDRVRKEVVGCSSEQQDQEEGGRKKERPSNRDKLAAEASQETYSFFVSYLPALVLRHDPSTSEHILNNWLKSLPSNYHQASKASQQHHHGRNKPQSRDSTVRVYTSAASLMSLRRMNIS